LFNSRITAICLPFDKNISKSLEEEGNSGYIAGWGQLSYKGNKSDILQEAKIFISSQDECRNAFKNFTVKITDEYLCAGTEGSAIDSCEGDSGGPFMQRDPNGYQFYLTGITSFGKKCATPGFPGVYTRVSKFLNWITNNL
jgi:secreted trypsin-like serine protease